MSQENVIRLLASSAKVAKKTTENIKAKSSEYIKEHILGNEFVTRAEYEQLRQLVLKLSEEMRSQKS